MKVTPTIPHISGFSEVEDLLVGGTFMQCTDIWRMSLEHYIDGVGTLRERLVLELIGDIGAPFTDRVAVIMEAPTQITYPTSHQVLGLDIEDIRERGMEGISWQAYDYESSELRRIALPFDLRDGPTSNKAMQTERLTPSADLGS